MTEKLIVPILTREHPPRYASDGAAAFDITASGRPTKNRWGVWEVPTDIAFAVPEGYVMRLYIRSSLGRKGVTLANSVGVIDSDYRGEVKGMLINQVPRSDEEFIDLIWDEAKRRGNRFMQGIIEKLPAVELKKVDSLNETARGSGGFGSTGA